MTERNTRIRYSQIASVRPDDLDATNALVNNYIPSYDESTGKFTWVAQGSGGGTVSNIEDLNDVDFDSGTPTDGQALIYDSASGKWKAETIPGGTEIKDTDGDTKIQVEESSDEDKIRFDIAGTEQFIIEDGKILPTTNNDIDLGSSSKKFKDGYFAGKLTVDGLIDPTGLVLNTQAINPMGSGQLGVWIDSGDNKLYYYDSSDSKEILNSDHTDTYNHSNIHEQNKDTYLAFGTVDQVSAGNVKDAVDKKHTQNTDTKLDEGGGNETSASELRTALDTTIPGKATKIGGGVENNFVSIDASGDIQDSGHKDSDYADAVHDHDSDYLAKDNTDPFTPDADYEPATKKYVDDALSGGGFGDMLKTTYDQDDDGIVDEAEALNDGTSGDVNKSTASEVRQAVDDSHTHDNKALLDTYDQTNTDISDAVSKKHSRQHAIDSSDDHTSTITENNLIDADANGLPDDSGLAVSDVSDAVDKKHTQNTDTGTNQDTFSIGDGTEGAHKLLEANIGQSGTQPAIRYNKDTNAWQLSNNGSTWNDIEAGTGSGDMLKSTYDIDEDGIVDKAETIDDGAGNSASASDVKDAVDKKHEHTNKAQLDLISDGDHDVRTDNPHSVDLGDLGISSSAENIDDAVDKKHAQNTDTGTNQNSFGIGDSNDTDKTLTAEIGQSGTQPGIKYDTNLNKWRFSNDGSSYQDFGSGGSLTVKEVDGNPTINNVSEIQIDQDSGLVVTELSGGIAKISIGSHWKNLVVDGSDTLIPDGVESLEIEAGSGIAITTNSGTDPQKITISASGSANSYRTNFTNATLSSAGILTVTHSLNQKYVVVQIYNNEDKMIIPDDIELVNANSLYVDLSGFGTLTGTWNVVIIS